MRKILNIIFTLFILVSLSLNVSAIKVVQKDTPIGVVTIESGEISGIQRIINSLFAIKVTPAIPKVGEKVTVELGGSVDCDPTGVGYSTIFVNGPSNQYYTFYFPSDLPSCSSFSFVSFSFTPNQAGNWIIAYSIHNGAGNRQLASDEKTVRVVSAFDPTTCQDECSPWVLVSDIDTCTKLEERTCYDRSVINNQCIENSNVENREVVIPGCTPSYICGNGYLDPGETCENCPQDKGQCSDPNLCGNNVCDPGEAEKCPNDCKYLDITNKKCCTLTIPLLGQSDVWYKLIDNKLECSSISRWYKDADMSICTGTQKGVDSDGDGYTDTEERDAGTDPNNKYDKPITTGQRCTKDNGEQCTLKNALPLRDDTQSSDECKSGICVDIGVGTGKCGAATETTGGIEIQPHSTCIAMGTATPTFNWEKFFSFVPKLPLLSRVQSVFIYFVIIFVLWLLASVVRRG